MKTHGCVGATCKCQADTSRIAIGACDAPFLIDAIGGFARAAQCLKDCVQARQATGSYVAFQGADVERGALAPTMDVSTTRAEFTSAEMDDAGVVDIQTFEVAAMYEKAVTKKYCIWHGR